MIHIGESYDSFRKLRENDAYYVDKTIVLKEFLEDRFKATVLFARPRRFGKTLTMTMFRDFLDIRQESGDIFAGLEIMGHQEVVARFMNQYPVVFLSLKEVFGDTYELVYKSYRLAIANCCKGVEDILRDESLNEADRATFRALEFQDADEVNTVAALDLLARMLCAHYGKPAFVIIDEYDVPMARALGTPHYDSVRDMVEHVLSYVCKTNDNVKAVMLSGCLYTVKNSAYTGVNNIIPYTVLSPVFASAIGFTDGDVRRLLADAGLEGRYEAVAEWYDGYLFGREKMYCPWDVLRYVASVLDGSYSEAMGPESYWVNTSETSSNLVHGFLGKTMGANEVFERLLAGETIDCAVSESLPYHRIHGDGENLWSALVETGYLTKTLREKMPLMPLRIPNKSIEVVFRREAWDYFRDKVDNAFVRDLAGALWAGEAGRAEAALCQILEATLSFYHEYHEYSYHLILDGFFTGLGYRVLSELETGYGRSDLVVLDPARDRCLILELKHVRTEGEVEAALREASSQILKKKYDSRLRCEGYDTRMRYAMAFRDKRAAVRLTGEGV